MNEGPLRGGRDHVASSRPALLAFLGAIGVCVLLGLLYIADVVTDDRYLGTGGVIAAGCLMTFVAALVSDFGRFRGWMRTSLGITWVAAATWCLLLWFASTPIGSEPTFRFAGAITIVAVWCVVAGVTLAPRSRGTAVLAARWSTFALITWWAAFGVFAIASERAAAYVIEQVVGPDAFVRFLGGSAVIAAAGFVAQPVLIKLGRVEARAGEGVLRGRRTRVSFACPRCGGACDLEANSDASCPTCQLALRVEFEEPRCACGYLLHGLAAPDCPECGRTVPESKRWRAQVPEPGAPAPGHVTP
jgi:hypothetical protein